MRLAREAENRNTERYTASQVVVDVVVVIVYPLALLSGVALKRVHS